MSLFSRAENKKKIDGKKNKINEEWREREVSLRKGEGINVVKAFEMPVVQLKRVFKKYRLGRK